MGDTMVAPMAVTMDQAKELVARFVAQGGKSKICGPSMLKFGFVTKAAGKDGTIAVTMTTESVDRHGDSVRSSGAKLASFRKNPVVLFGHRHDLPAVGRVVSIEKGAGKIDANVEFAPTAMGQELKALYEGGFMKAWSIGFIPLKWEPIRTASKDSDEDDITGLDIKSWELLELSAVPVPANAEALSKAMDMVTDATLLDILKQDKSFDAPEVPVVEADEKEEIEPEPEVEPVEPVVEPEPVVERNIDVPVTVTVEPAPITPPLETFDAPETRGLADEMESIKATTEAIDALTVSIEKAADAYARLKAVKIDSIGADDKHMSEETKTVDQPTPEVVEPVVAEPEVKEFDISALAKALGPGITEAARLAVERAKGRLAV